MSVATAVVKQSLAGGFNLYQYAPNPIGWIDPLDLSTSCPDSGIHINPKDVAGKKPEEIDHLAC